MESELNLKKNKIKNWTRNWLDCPIQFKCGIETRIGIILIFFSLVQTSNPQLLCNYLNLSKEPSSVDRFQFENHFAIRERTTGFPSLYVANESESKEPWIKVIQKTPASKNRRFSWEWKRICNNKLTVPWPRLHDFVFLENLRTVGSSSSSYIYRKKAFDFLEPWLWVLITAMITVQIQKDKVHG